MDEVEVDVELDVEDELDVELDVVVEDGPDVVVDDEDGPEVVDDEDGPEVVDDEVLDVVTGVPTADCVNTKDLPAMTSVAARCAPGLACTLYCALPFPLAAGGCTVTQGTNDCALQPQPGCVVTVTSPIAPPGTTTTLVGFRS